MSGYFSLGVGQMHYFDLLIKGTADRVKNKQNRLQLNKTNKIVCFCEKQTKTFAI